MKQKVLYTCELCGTDYNSKDAARSCEKSHKVDLEIVKKRFVSCKQNESGFPVTIEVRDNKTGKTRIYR